MAQLAQKPLKTQLCHYQITTVKRNRRRGKRRDFLLVNEEEGSCLVSFLSYKSQWQRFNLSRLKSGRNDALLKPFLSHFSYAMNCRLRRQENREKLEHQVRVPKKAFYVFQVFLSLFPHQYQIIWIWFLFGANRIVPSPKCWSDRLSPN